ncbi:MAG: hypothetical protein GY710_18410 [Desulfobacteraceae bacterium]|nr:hypothetical protein [Desulfobacteraceae bacterium]
MPQPNFYLKKSSEREAKTGQPNTYLKRKPRQQNELLNPFNHTQYGIRIQLLYYAKSYDPGHIAAILKPWDLDTDSAAFKNRSREPFRRKRWLGVDHGGMGIQDRPPNANPQKWFQRWGFKGNTACNSLFHKTNANKITLPALDMGSFEAIEAIYRKYNHFKSNHREYGLISNNCAFHVMYLLYFAGYIPKPIPGDMNLTRPYIIVRRACDCGLAILEQKRRNILNHIKTHKQQFSPNSNSFNNGKAVRDLVTIEIERLEMETGKEEGSYISISVAKKARKIQELYLLLDDWDNLNLFQQKSRSLGGRTGENIRQCVEILERGYPRKIIKKDPALFLR